MAEQVEVKGLVAVAEQAADSESRVAKAKVAPMEVG